MELQPRAAHHKHRGEGRVADSCVMSDYFDSLLADPAVSTIGLAVGIAVIAIWLAAAWWAHADAARRTERDAAGYLAAGWILLSTPLLMPLALAIYALARPGLTASEQRGNVLAMELLATTGQGPACPGCRGPVDSRWLRCPRCTTWLAALCGACGAWSERGLEICPFCAAEVWDAPQTIEATPALRPLGRGVQPRPRRAGRAARPHRARPLVRGHEAAAAGVLPTAADSARVQRERFISSTRPRSYSASRESLSAPS